MDAGVQGLLEILLGLRVGSYTMKAHKGKTGFTLIELLVVISIIALLTGALLPILGRVRRQVKSVLCQSNLRQWGMAFTEYLADNHNQMPQEFFVFSSTASTAPVPPPWFIVLRPYLGEHSDIIFCPMATKRNLGKVVPDDPRWAFWGSTFTAWGGLELAWVDPEGAYGSYGTNAWVRHLPERRNPETGQEYHGSQYFWKKPASDRNAARIPVLLDSMWFTGGPREIVNHFHPPKRDGIPVSKGGVAYFCINRHDGGVNSLFMDWSVRKVGLKELWTMKWHPGWNTANKWTLAGGVQPDDWPEWMRGFKDY